MATRAELCSQSQAAITVQKVWRGYCTRCKLFALLEPKASLMCTSKASRTHSQTFNDVTTPSPLRATVFGLRGMSSNRPFSSSRSLLRIQKKYRDYLDGCIERGLQPYMPAVASFHSFCAKRIQTWWRASRPLRKGYRRQTKASILSGEDAAAVVIQRCWRRHIDMQVFQYYRDLVNFRNRGNPAVMLKCINPAEAQLLDPAASARVKFRLAGETFPPNIYYKIFIQCPIQDMCANSPRAYTAMCNRLLAAKDIHNKGVLKQEPDKSSWYQRWENNGWRLVSDRLLHKAQMDPVTCETSKKKIEFKHVKVHRRNDVERRRRKKRIEWMKKLYSGSVDKQETIGGEPPDDVEDLIEWTSALDFDEYVSNWHSFATTATSDDVVKNRFLALSEDPFELKLC